MSMVYNLCSFMSMHKVYSWVCSWLLQKYSNDCRAVTKGSKYIEFGWQPDESLTPNFCNVTESYLSICTSGGSTIQADLEMFKEDIRFKDSPANRAVFAVKYRYVQPDWLIKLIWIIIKNGMLLCIFMSLLLMCRVMKILDFFFNYCVHLRLVVSLLSS